MNAFKNTLVAIMMMAVTVTLTSCGGTPEGNDSDVKETVKQIYSDDIKDTAFQITWYEVVDSIDGPEGDFEGLVGLIDMVEHGSWRTIDKRFDDYEESYKEVLQEYRKDNRDTTRLEGLMKTYKKHLDTLHDRYYERIESPEAFKLENIRTVEIDEEVGKSTSDATVTIFDVIKQEIRYTAQRNDKGEIYVEVFKR